MPLNPNPTEFELEWWLGDAILARQTSHETSDGFVYVCEACEAPWAAKYFPNRALIRMYGACERHPPSRGEIPGSLVLWWFDELERMPDALVHREYGVHLAYYIKEIERVQATSGDTRATISGPSAAELLAELEGGAGDSGRPSA